MRTTVKTRPHAIPFGIDRTLAVGIETQLTDGLRTAILSGYYKAGERIPTVRDFADALGVSIRVPKAALRVLKREGLVSTRRRLGTVVTGPETDVFKGRIVVADPDLNPTFYGSSLEKRLCRRLADAGYLVSRVVTPIVERPAGDLGSERFDLRQFNTALRQNTSLAVIVCNRPHLAQAPICRGTPFAMVGLRGEAAAPGCVGFASLDLERALPAIVERLRTRKVRRLVQVALHDSEYLDEAPLRAACESVESMELWPDGALSATLDEIVRLAFDTFSARYRTKADLPDAFLFTDDYLARGALTALLAAGFETGRDVLAITLANKGIAPVHPHPVDLILRDPVVDAATLADALLGYLETGTPAGDITLGLEYVAASFAP